MNAIISVIGKDKVGILAKVSEGVAKFNGSVNDVTQTIIDDYFVMIMIVNITELSIDFNSFVDEMQNLGKNMNLEIHCMHEDIFNLMHNI